MVWRTGFSLFLLPVMLHPSACTSPPEQASGDPGFDNIVVIIGDDHAAYALGCYGNDRIRTPNLDRLAENGLRFTRAYANAPLCSASRQSILTGRYPHAAGVTLLRTSFPEEQHTIAEHLQKRGFRTGVFGKTHFNNEGRHGFETMVSRSDWQQYLEQHPPAPIPDSIDSYGPWRPFHDPAAIWLNAAKKPLPYRDEEMEDTYYARRAAAYIESNRDRRFCVWVGFHNPHSPFNFPVEYRDKYDPAGMILPPGSPEDDRWIPEVFRNLTDEEKRGIIASYYTSVEHLDKNAGLIIDKIDELGLGDRTLIVYIGDQGYLLGHHKRFEKHMMWEEAIRSPLLIRGGSRFGRGRTVDALTEFIDLAPTILEALGIGAMPESYGQSLMPVLKGETGTHKDFAFSEFLVDNKAMIRSDRWKYIFSTGKRDLGQGYATGNPPPGITHRLYDLHSDPYEHHDVSKDPDKQAVLTEMQQTMLDLFRATYPGADTIPASLSVEEQLVRFCVAPDENADIEAQ